MDVDGGAAEGPAGGTRRGGWERCLRRCTPLWVESALPSPAVDALADEPLVTDSKRITSILGPVFAAMALTCAYTSALGLGLRANGLFATAFPYDDNGSDPLWETISVRGPLRPLALPQPRGRLPASRGSPPLPGRRPQCRHIHRRGCVLDLRLRPSIRVAHEEGLSLHPAAPHRASALAPSPADPMPTHPVRSRARPSLSCSSPHTPFSSRRSAHWCSSGCATPRGLHLAASNPSARHATPATAQASQWVPLDWVSFAFLVLNATAVFLTVTFVETQGMTHRGARPLRHRCHVFPAPHSLTPAALLCLRSRARPARRLPHAALPLQRGRDGVVYPGLHCACARGYAQVATSCPRRPALRQVVWDVVAVMTPCGPLRWAMLLDEVRSFPLAVARRRRSNSPPH